jgi:hypothetical protein
MGMAKIREQITQLSGLGVKAGIVEGSGAIDGVSIAEYAAYNEYGVPGKTKKWNIPPRPFIRGWLEDHADEIKTVQETLFKKVSEGKISADMAIKRLGQFAEDGIKRYIKTGNFEPNAEATIQRKGGKRKKSSRPLIDTGTMRNSIRYEVINGGKK